MRRLVEPERRRSCRTVLDQLFHCLTTWWAPVLAFTMDEVWLSRFPGEGSSVHLMQFARCPDEWAAPELAAKWDRIRDVRSVVTGALEIERQVKKTIGSALEAAPDVYVSDPDLLAALDGVDLAEISITSGATLIAGRGSGGCLPARCGEGRCRRFQARRGQEVRPVLEDHAGGRQRSRIPRHHAA